MRIKYPAGERLVATFSGTVQGVGFRYTALSESRGFEVRGTVKNLRDGRVELVAEWDRKELMKFLGRLQTVFRQHVKDVQVQWEPAMGGFDGFGIAH